MKKILIMYGSYGNGHKSIAEYVESYVKENGNDIEIKTIDILDYSTLFGNLCYKAFMAEAAMKGNILRNIIYSIFDHKTTTFQYYKLVQKSFNKRIESTIIEYNPDLIVSTHYFASTIASKLKKKKSINSKLITIVTDYVSHELWRKNYEYEDAIVVGNEILENELVNKEIPKEKIKVYGIPLSSKFNNNDYKKTDILKNYNLIGNKLIFTFLGGGGTGYTSNLDYFKRLVKQKLNIDIIFICGKNEELKRKCDKYIKKKKIKNVSILGFTHDMPNILAISDAVITKPGGAIITEAIALHKPIILIPGLGGNEKGNARFIVKKGFGLNTRTPIGLSRKIKKIYNNPTILYKMKKNYLKDENKDSMKSIYKLCMTLLKEK